MTKHGFVLLDGVALALAIVYFDGHGDEDRLVVQLRRVVGFQDANGLADRAELALRDVNSGLVLVLQVQTCPEFAALVLAVDHLEYKLQVFAVTGLGRFEFRCRGDHDVLPLW